MTARELVAATEATRAACETLAEHLRACGLQYDHGVLRRMDATPDDAYLNERFHSNPKGSWNANKWRHPQEHGNLVGWRQFRRRLGS